MRLLGWLTALFVLLAGAVALDGLGDGRDDGRPRAVVEGVRLASLSTFDDCAELTEWYAEAAEVGPVTLADRQAMPTAGLADDAATTAYRSSTGTNVQEAGVDEPDVIKTDGELLVAVIGGRTHIVDATTEQLLATLDVPGNGNSGELLLSGDRVLVVSRNFVYTRSSRPASDQPYMAGQETTTLTAVDVSEPSAPRVIETAVLDGGYVSARLTGTTARVVVREYPQILDPAAASDQWLPSMSVGGGEPEPLIGCDAVSHPIQPSGLGTTTVVTLDVEGSLQPLDTDTVASDAATIYASTDRLYVATHRWNSVGTVAMTDLHAFDTTGAETTSYLGSGEVEGGLLNQFSLSEHEGVLRVATTIEGENLLTTLGESDGGLRRLGQVRGLGPDERIYAVRFLGDVGYVVTFRQTDPLYALDLTDPAAPRVTGELKIPGFSAYLHPIGDGRLLGVGQDATADGQQTGLQLSLFDVASSDAPARLDTLGVANGHSMVEHDHKAFLWWAETDLAVIPYEAYDPNGRGLPDVGVLVVGADGDQLVERGRLTHGGRPDWPNDVVPTVQRSMVVGDVLWTLSDAGLLASNGDDLADRAWLPFPS